MPAVTDFIEHLTARNWCRTLLWDLLNAGGSSGRRRAYVFDHSRPGLAAARLCQWITGVRVEPFHFRLLDVRDEQGLLIRSKVNHWDLGEVASEAMQDARILEALQGEPASSRLPLYLLKALATNNPSQRTLWRALVTIQVCAWKLRQEQSRAGRCFLERRPFWSAIDRYAARAGICARPVAPPFRLTRWLQDHAPTRLQEWLRGWAQQAALARLWFRSWRSGKGSSKQEQAITSARAAVPSAPIIAVEYTGLWNLAHRDRYSNVFFWQQSALPARSLLVLFGRTGDPLTREKWVELAQQDMRSLALEPQAAAVHGVPIAAPRFQGSRRRAGSRRRVGGATPEARWVRKQLGDYERFRAAWEDLFASRGVKIFVSWFKITELHCAIADALRELGGIMTIYQRSFESHPSPECAVGADVVFGFSPASAGVGCGSDVPYCIVTGYLDDHLFPLLRPRAASLRARLQQRGARRIISFTDENSQDEERYSLGHTVTRKNYAFLLQHVLAEPWLGLILKPKAPSTLRRRLGPVAPLLDRALATGRCLIFEEGARHGVYPPAAAGLASDLMIHGHLLAATAGVECALAGIPTVFLDQEGWTASPFYQLGEGRVVFRDWDRLWKTCLEHWGRPDGVPGFGDWSPILQTLDPFRDGRAAERMGTYLHWLLQGFEAGLPRETVLADAADRYAQAWGKDKVLQVGEPARESVKKGEAATAAEELAVS